METSDRPPPTDLTEQFEQTPFAFDFFRAVIAPGPLTRNPSTLIAPARSGRILPVSRIGPVHGFPSTSGVSSVSECNQCVTEMQFQTGQNCSTPADWYARPGTRKDSARLCRITSECQLRFKLSLDNGLNSLPPAFARWVTLRRAVASA